jgi:hypothetical protein
MCCQTGVCGPSGIDGDIAVRGRYPSRDELAGLLAARVDPVVARPKSTDSGCGCSPGGC